MAVVLAAPMDVVHLVVEHAALDAKMDAMDHAQQDVQAVQRHALHYVLAAVKMGAPVVAQHVIQRVLDSVSQLQLAQHNWLIILNIYDIIHMRRIHD